MKLFNIPKLLQSGHKCNQDLYAHTLHQYARKYSIKCNQEVCKFLQFRNMREYDVPNMQPILSKYENQKDMPGI